MEVIVNGENIADREDWEEPSDSEKLGQYLEDVGEELQSTNRALSSIRVDGEWFDEEYNEVKCGQFDKLELEVESILNLTIRSIGDLGSYCHRFMDKIPEIVSKWGETSAEQLEEYRRQVLNALEATKQVLSSVGLVTHLSGETDRVDLEERAKLLAKKLKEADQDEMLSLFEDPLSTFFNDLLEELDQIIDQIKDQEDQFEEKLQEIQEKISDFLDEINVLSNEMDEGGEVEIFKKERKLDLMEQLTGINKFLNQLDQTGKLKMYFPPEEQEQVEKNLRTLYDSLAKFVEQLHEEQPEKLISFLKKDIRPSLEKFQNYLEEFKPGKDQ